jgi:hypothetical protein
MAVQLRPDDVSIEDLFQALIAQLSWAPFMPRPEAPNININTPLLAGTLTYLTEHPEEHDQTEWSRPENDGTVVGCVAYHAARLAGHTMDRSLAGRDGQCAHVAGIGCTGVGTELNHLFGVAQNELGLTHEQALRLFSPFNTLGKLWALAEEFTGGAVTRQARGA